MSISTTLRKLTVKEIRLYHFMAAVAICGLCSIPLGTIYIRNGLASGYLVYVDFSAYWLAVERWQHGLPLYVFEDFGFVKALPVNGVVQYVYPPVVVLLIYPFQFVPYPVAGTLWSVATVISFWLALVILLEEYYPMTWPRRILVFPFVFFFQPVWLAFRLGQITSLLAALVTMSAVAMERAHAGDDPVWIGLGVAGAAFVKPYIAPAGAVLLLSRRRLAGAALTVIGLIGVGIAVFGVNTHVEYVWALLDAKPAAPTHIFTIRTPHWGWFEPFDVLGDPWAWLPRIVLLTTVAGLAAWRTDTLDADRAAFAAGAVVVPLAAPEAYALDFVFYVPAVIVLIAARPSWWPWLSLTLVASHWQPWTMRCVADLGVSTEMAAVLQPGLYAGFLILGAALAILWRSRRKSITEFLQKS